MMRRSTPSSKSRGIRRLTYYCTRPCGLLPCAHWRMAEGPPDPLPPLPPPPFGPSPFPRLFPPPPLPPPPPPPPSPFPPSPPFPPPPPPPPLPPPLPFPPPPPPGCHSICARRLNHEFQDQGTLESGSSQQSRLRLLSAGHSLLCSF